ncbi:unnamed protein product, partial [Acanthoscelides obtectus]
DSSSLSNLGSVLRTTAVFALIVSHACIILLAAGSGSLACMARQQWMKRCIKTLSLVSPLIPKQDTIINGPQLVHA